MRNNASNVSELKNRNRALILNEIRKRPVSRAQLAADTSLSKSAVTAIVNELIAQGRLTEKGAVSAPKGRRPVLLDIEPRCRLAAGAELHRGHITVVITDLRAAAVASETADIKSFGKSGEAVAFICEGIRRLAAGFGVPVSELIGVGVSSPGPLDSVSGVILDPPNFAMFKNTPIAGMISAELGLPVLLENNSVSLARREYYTGRMKDYKNSLFVIVSHGIGSCAIMDGRIYRGFAGYAGELGHTSIDLDGPLCSCCNRGCVELYATLAALRHRFSFESYEKLVDSAYAGDGRSLEIMRFEARCLAAAFIGAINMLDLDSIFLYGELNYRPELLVSMINDIIDERSIIRKAHPVAVHPSGLSPAAAAAASTTAVIDRYFDGDL